MNNIKKVKELLESYKDEKKEKIPHWLLPAFWGLKGTTKLKAIIEYYYEGFIKDEMLAYLLSRNERELEEKLNDIKYNYDMIDNREYEEVKAKCTLDGTSLEITLLDIKYQYNEISEQEYEKEKASLLGDPWFTVVDVVLDEDSPSMGRFEFDWNDKFIELLENNGYVAPSQEETIEQWFNDICKNVALSEFNGLGDFNERLDNAIESRKNSHVTKVKIDDSNWSIE